MKFLILTNNGSYIVDADGFDTAAALIYDDHTKYDDITAIIKLPSD